MPGSSWTQKFSGSTVVFVIGLVCFIVGWITNLQILTTLAYILFIVVAVMGIYAICFTTKLSKGSVISPSEHTVVQMQQNQEPQGAVINNSSRIYPNIDYDEPPPYSIAVKSSQP